MKKLLLIFTTIFTVTSGLSAAVMTDAEAKKQAQDILSGLVSGHNLAFGKDHLYKEALDLSMWNKAFSNMKTFVNKAINENTNFFGMKSSTLTNALDKITKAEMDLVNNIKITRGVLKSPANLQKQVATLNKIKTDMLAVQGSLKSPVTPVAKDEARKLLNSAAMFIETTAAKAVRDTTKPL